MAKQKKSEAAAFTYVDAHWEDPGKKKRSPKWKRIKIDEIDDFKNQNSNYNVFCTVQRFKNPVYTSPELAYMPFYFDLDSSRSLMRLLQERRMDITALGSKLTATEYAHLSNYMTLDMELDEKQVEAMEKKLTQEIWDTNLAISQSDAIKLTTFFKEELGLMPEDVRVYFSGKKGFHLMISPEALGIVPHNDLHLIFKYAALYLMQKLKLEALDYGSIYSVRRMIRLVDSIHQGSRLFKIEITHDELQMAPADIRALAKSPRGSLYTEVNEQLNTTANEWYLKKKQEWEEAERTKAAQVVVKDKLLSAMESYPLCVQDIMDNGIKKSGDRNKATMALASYFKDIGTDRKETEQILVAWSLKLSEDMTSANNSVRKLSTLTAVRTIYEDDKYHFACAFIRSLHGSRKGRDCDMVQCGGRACPIHEDHRIDLEEADKMHLSDTARAEYTGKKVSFDCLVSGKLDTPYIVPKKVNYACFMESECDKECIMHDYGGFFDREFHENERVLIEATSQNDNNLKGILRHYSGATCKAIVANVVDYVNVEELLVVPMAERVTTIDKGNGDYVSIDETGREYVSRKMYFVGNKIIPNQYYEFEGYVYPHPKNQVGTVLSQKQTPKQDSIGSFKLDDTLREQFKIFQQQPGESLDDRLDVVLKDITENVTLVWQRDEVLLGVLLTYHSALTFDFQNQRLKRGWLETILIGDAGTAKTQLVQNLVEYAGVGELASGESSSRTGLVYRLEQIGERWFITWGKYPLNDKRLLAIDEVTGLSKEDLGTITESRSTGVLKVDRAVNAETNSRTRLVFMCNPREGKQLSYFSHGIEAVKSVFGEAADIRRLDLPLLLSYRDVPKSVLNRRYVKPDMQLIPSDLMKNSILWAWSRKPEDILMTEDAIDAILHHAGELADKYGCADDIPIVCPAEERIKLARVAVALATMLHSTDETHEKVIVKAEHVEFACDYLQMLFDAPNCRYDKYAENARSEGVLEDGELESAKVELSKLDTEDSLPLSKDILELFRRNDVLKSQEIQDMTGQTRELVNARLSVLSKYNFLKRTRGGFAKLPKFIEFLDIV